MIHLASAHEVGMLLYDYDWSCVWVCEAESTDVGQLV